MERPAAAGASAGFLHDLNNKQTRASSYKEPCLGNLYLLRLAAFLVQLIFLLRYQIAIPWL